MVLKAQNDLQSASDEFRRSIAMHKIALEAEPINVSYRENLGKSLANLSQLLRQLGDNDAEFETLRQRLDLWTNDATNLQCIAEEMATLVNRSPQLEDELVKTLGLCRAAGVKLDDLLNRPAFQLLPPILRDRLK